MTKVQIRSYGKAKMDLSAILDLHDAEQAARAKLNDAVWAYIAGGAGSEHTVHGNVDAFNAVWLRPRVLGEPCRTPDLRVTLFNHVLSIPILLAPTSPQRLVHEEAELATARAATAAGTISIVSTDSQYPFPVIAEASKKNCWFQLYAYRSRSDMEAVIEMAEEAGALALVITVDAQHPALRIGVLRAGFHNPSYVDFGTLRTLGILTGTIPANARLDRLPLTWRDLERIRRRTTMPLVVKGVLHPHDARRCVETGVDGVIVSNHGGRQLDAVVPSLIALEQVAAEIRDDCVVLVDGGIRSGVDVLKALSLGAHAVCIGRPYLWGLSIGGQAGIQMILRLLRNELENALLQLGRTAVADIGTDCASEIRWSPAFESLTPLVRTVG